MRRNSPVVRVAIAVVLSVAAIALAPVVMGPSYTAMQPRLGPLTLVVVEVLYALFIDFPLATLYVALVTLASGPRRNPARSAVGFVLLFFALIGLCMVLAPVSDLLAYWALADTFPAAVAEASTALGRPTFAILGVAFVVFDLLLCAGGGIIGSMLVGSRAGTSVSHVPSQIFHGE